MRKHILNVPVDVITMDQTLDFVFSYVKMPDNPTGYILSVNPEKVMILRKDRELCSFFERATLLIPDGIGVVWGLRRYGYKAQRVPGADLMQNICAESPKHGVRLFIFGGKEEVNARATDILRLRCPGIQIVGRKNGYVKKEDMPELIKEINDSKAQILFVALGSPNQEKWMNEYANQLTTVKLCQGIGGTLDTITGDVKRAPLAMQKCNLEWFYRLLHQPTRLFRQLHLLQYAFLVMKEKMI